ncbi:SDR family oxidoreductase [Dactylosporangium sp. AC04546]|uniref:SDR family NAD(P)-dependent oxidoreductase n=1 Tax=Dactylosporangium sp. AC04546 TaxID=2862460 RepID=UPI001EDED925|nr:SDR family oxidoreductase [Dactylosporangium sp. AC04546]WVK80903.1 SDR family oxidoreductase [Dactylosporangium sp. AC04546]
MPEPRHEGRALVVTGAGSGIGRATVLRLLAEGARVLAFDIVPERLRSLEEEAGERARLVTVAGDVAAQDDVERGHAAALSSFGGYDGLANVAGVMDWFLPAHEVDDETWTRVMDVNVLGTMRTSRLALRHFLQRGAGSIVNVASEAATRGAAGGFAYTAAKHAVLGQTRSIAWAYRGDGIRCNAVCPGAVDTDLGSSAQPRSDFGLERVRPILRLRGPSVHPDRIAGTISWLLSDEADNVTGALLLADGGWAAG